MTLSVYGMSDNVRYFEGIPLSPFYRTYRTLPYTVPPQRKALALSCALGNIANVVFPQQRILLHIQRPHDPVRREAPAAVHLGETLRKLRRRAAPRRVLFVYQPRKKFEQRAWRLSVRFCFRLKQFPAQMRSSKPEMQSELRLVTPDHLQNSVRGSALIFM